MDACVQILPSLASNQRMLREHSRWPGDKTRDCSIEIMLQSVKRPKCPQHSKSYFKNMGKRPVLEKTTLLFARVLEERFQSKTLTYKT